MSYAYTRTLTTFTFLLSKYRDERGYGFQGSKSEGKDDAMLFKPKTKPVILCGAHAAWGTKE